MKILAYGEDALTLWALKYKLAEILELLGDPSSPEDCTTFYRPSFGRRGGPNSSQFGEFDFILLSEQCVYLGESKWDSSSEKITDGVLALREEQLLRHRLMEFYIREWSSGKYECWSDFRAKARPKLQKLGIEKPLAPAGSRLADNLQDLLTTISRRYATVPEIRNLLLFLHEGAEAAALPRSAGDDFVAVTLDYSPDLQGNYIRLED